MCFSVLYLSKSDRQKRQKIENVFAYKTSVSSLTVTESRVSQRANYVSMVSCDVFRFSWFGGEAH